MTGAESTTFALITNGLTSRIREERLLAIQGMGILGVAAHADLLIDLLGSPDESVILAVLEALGGIGNPKSVKYVLEFLHAENHTIAEKALEVLARFPLDKVLDPVLKAAAAEPSVPIRKRLLLRIRDIRDPRVSAFMCELIGQTKEVSLLIEALGYFIRFPSAERATILRMLSSNSQWELSLLANVALSRLGDESARAHWKRLLKSPAQPIRVFLLEALNLNPLPADREVYEAFFQDSHPQIRAGALQGLDIFTHDERARLLRDWVARERDDWVLSELYRVMHREKDPAFFPEFFALLGSSSEVQKKVGIAGLSAMGERALERILADTPKMSQVVKEKVLIVLGNIGGEKACRAVLPFLEAKERWLRINAIDALVTMKAITTVDRLAALLRREEDIWVKATLLSALSHLGDASLAPLFLEHLHARDARVRANAIEGLWKAGGDHSQVLLPLLTDPNDRVRVNAAIALWKSGNLEVLDTLIGLTRKGTKWVRSSAAFALGEIGDKEATPALLDLLKDPEEVVYRNAMEALTKIGDLRALLPLLGEREHKRVSAETFGFFLGRFAKNLHQ